MIKMINLENYLKNNTYPGRGVLVGKTEENYTEIDAISGATLTTDGYKQAIERAFAALEILKGGM